MKNRLLGFASLALTLAAFLLAWHLRKRRMSMRESRLWNKS